MTPFLVLLVSDFPLDSKESSVVFFLVIISIYSKVFRVFIYFYRIYILFPFRVWMWLTLEMHIHEINDTTNHKIKKSSGKKTLIVCLRKATEIDFYCS